ncbi:MAG: MerR family transcriptional regulator [Deltaproteobacteria bacterium]|nr:MerR family transcriptional regulator [Deltaproteobacteria bacterium]
MASRIAALPPPPNGQVRAVPDDRTVRYYGTIGLLDRPLAMRGRTALYGPRHLAQVVAIKRLQTIGRSLAEIQALWPTLDDDTLSRMAGVPIAPKGRAARAEFWKHAPAREPAMAAPAPTSATTPARAIAPSGSAGVELRLELAANVSLAIALSDDIALSLADVAAIRAAAAPLIAELARRQLAAHAREGEDQ